jgi:general secretion pathway protein D
MNRHSPFMARLALLLCSTVAAAQTPPPSTQRITPNFQNVDITVLAEAVGAATGVTFIPDPRVRAQVSLINPRPMTPQELYHAFLSILQVYNFAAVRSGNIVKIVPDSNIRTMPANDMPANLNFGTDEIVTTVLEAKNVSAIQLATVLRQLVAQYGNLQPVPGTNSMIITDRASNVARIQRILNRIDQAGNAGVEVIRLENSTASDVVRTLSALTQGQPADAGGGIAPRMVADDRSNSILISGEPQQRLRIATWVAHLDTPIDNGGGTEVIYLKYADAEKIAPKLKEQATGVAAAAAGGGAGAATADRSVTIIADKQTNALIVTAPPKTMRQLRSIVDKLDIALAQVQVEAIIADVGESKAADIGVNWALFSNENGTNVPAGGFISPVADISLVDLIQGVANPATAAIPLGVTFGVGRLRDNGVNFGAMIRALRADGNTNVIATPSITTMDNQEAEMKNAQEVPFLTGQYTNTGSGGGGGGNVNPFTTVQRQEVGTILKVTPQLNGGNAMTLKIELESSELAGAVGDAGSQITNKRSIKTTVMIEDGGIIVIGGLIRDTKTTGETRVPFLGRIPLIGELFKTRNGTRAKSNLMVFIRPKIMSDSVQATIETNSKYNAIRDLQRRQNGKLDLMPLLPFDAPPQLPPATPPPAPATAPGPAAAAAPAPAPKGETANP